MGVIGYRQLVQNAVTAALAANFATNSTAIAQDPMFGGAATPISLDFTNASRNFVQQAIRKEDIELTPLFDQSPACMALATGNADNPRRVHGLRFSGTVDAHIIGVLTGQDGAESTNTEAQINAFEDAVWVTVTEYNWSTTIAAGISLVTVARSNRGDLNPLARGSRQWFEVIATFMVQIP